METFKFEGLDDVMKALEGLDDRIVINLFQSVNRKAVQEYVTKPLRSALPYSQKSKKGIITITDRKDRDNAAVWGGVSSDSYWLRFTEKGTKIRKTKKGYNRGAVVGANRVAPIVDGQVSELIKFVNEEYGETINSFLEKRIKKLKK